MVDMGQSPWSGRALMFDRVAGLKKDSLHKNGGIGISTFKLLSCCVCQEIAGWIA